MLDEFLNYLFNDLKDHVEKIKEEAYNDSPDVERIEYHHEKVTGIINLIQNKFNMFGANEVIRIIDGQKVV